MTITKKRSGILALTALVALSATLCPIQAPAQTKQETKLYNKTMKASSRAAYEKFLSKMPGSVYADDIRSRLDTLLSISPYSISEARGIAAAETGGIGSFFAVPDRENAVDRILVLELDSAGGTRFVTLEMTSGKWSNVSELKFEPDGTQELILTDGGEIVEVAGRKMLYCGALYKTTGNADGQMLFSRWLLGPFEDAHPRVDFFGTDILRKGEDLPFKIEGRIDEMTFDPKDKGAAWIRVAMASDPRLVELPFEVVQSDEAIRWWRRENAEAARIGGTLKFCTLPEGCSLISEYAKSKYRSRSSKYGAALFDYRGWTVIVAQNRETGAYNLAWAEPECKDHARDVLLNGISFRSPTALELQYFHGKKYYKRMLNLASMSLK